MTVRHTEDGIGWAGLVPRKSKKRHDTGKTNRVLICLKCGNGVTLLQDGHCGKCCQQIDRDKYMAEIRRIAVLMGSTIEASMQLPDDFLRYYEDGKTPAEAWMEEATSS